MNPPSVGPEIAASPATAPQMPNAAPRFSAGKMCVMSDRVCGVSSAPPTPCATRAPISQPGEPARPHAAEASVNTSIPARNSRFGPNRSPSRPAVMSRTAYTST